MSTRSTLALGLGLLWVLSAVQPAIVAAGVKRPARERQKSGRAVRPDAARLRTDARRNVRLGDRARVRRLPSRALGRVHPRAALGRPVRELAKPIAWFLGLIAPSAGGLAHSFATGDPTLGALGVAASALLTSAFILWPPRQ